MKLTKLAYKNVKKSYKDYLIYFLTLMFSVCLFYTFNSFQAQQEIMQLSENQNMMMQTTAIMLNALSVFVAIVLAFLILYANNFLIKRRKKEFGIYMLLGMPKKQISMVLVIETFFVGLLSLLVGLGVGVLCSQLLGVLTAALFQAEVHYHIVVSFSSMIMTIISFSLIFLTVMVLNTRIINKVKLIDLLHAKKQIEKQRVLKTWVAVLLLAASLACIGIAYFLTSGPLTVFGTMIVPIMIIGAIGTILFFVSLSGFLLQFIRHSKRFYYSKLHMFVLRQVNAKINTTSLSMAVVTLMLLLSIGALSIGLSLNTTLHIASESRTPYMYSYMQDEDISEEKMKELLMLNDSSYNNTISFYHGELYAKDIFPYLDQETQASIYPDAEILLIKESEYALIAQHQMENQINLKTGEAIFLCSSAGVIDSFQQLNQQQATVTTNHKTISITGVIPDVVFVSTYNQNTVSLIVSDDVVNESMKALTLWNIDIRDEAKLDAYQNEVEQRFTAYANSQDMVYSYSGVTRNEMNESYIGLGMIFTYIGLYLGIVFLMSSAAILALQQLSDAEDNKANYEILKKIGTEPRMISHAILQQIGIYFLLPLCLAIIHSIVGVPAVASAFTTVFGVENMGKDILITAGLLILLYGSYFMATYMGYKSALTK